MSTIQIKPSSSPLSPTELEEYKLHRRFDRFGRLVGDQAMKKLMESHVMVIGLGGVGSFAAESIARSGVGKVTVVDFDQVCITNFNRQIHAVHGQVGRQKSDVMAERLRLINPRADVRALPVFFNAESAEAIFEEKPDYIVDAIDHVTSKCLLLAMCRDRGIPVVCATGSGGRLDPSQVKVADLAQTSIDPLAKAVRGILREKHGFSTESSEHFGIVAVFSSERHTQPEELTYDGGKGFRCVCPQGDNPYFTCEDRNTIWGSSSFVTGTFGLFCASVAIGHLLETV